MNETVLERPAAMPQRETAPAAVTRRKDTPARGYLLLALAITYGYLLRDFGYITPESGVGTGSGLSAVR